MSALSTAETSRDGQLVPEAEVARDGPETMSFEARAAETVTQGSRRGRKTTGGTPVPPGGQTFEARAAETVTLRPPHWENLLEAVPEAEVSPDPASPMETAPPEPADGPSEPNLEPPASQSSVAADAPETATEVAEAAKEKES